MCFRVRVNVPLISSFPADTLHQEHVLVSLPKEHCCDHIPKALSISKELTKHILHKKAQYQGLSQLICAITVTSDFDSGHAATFTYFH